MTRPVDELKSSRSGQKAVIWKSEVRVDMEQPNMRLLFSAEEIERQVRRLANEISNDYQGCDLVLIGVLKGAFVFLADLVRQMTVPLQVDFVRLGSYGSSTISSGEVRIIADVQSNIQNRDVLIVEDIVDSGRTMEFLCNHLLVQNPRSLKICTLLDKLERRELAVSIDYAALQVNKGFVIGYGLDCNETGRQLPDICELIL